MTWIKQIQELMTSPNAHETCHLCGSHISSLRTRSIGDHYFCADCADSIMIPMVAILTENLIQTMGGDGYQDDRRILAESLEPGSKYRVTIGFGRIGPYPTSETQSSTGARSSTLSAHEDKRAVNAGEDQETETESE